MTELWQRLATDLVLLFVQRALDEAAHYMAEAYLQDLGESDCQVCLANRRREAWG
jgi:hypothetical protein